MSKATRYLIPLLVMCLLVSMFAGCSGSNTASTNNKGTYSDSGSSSSEASSSNSGPSKTTTKSNICLESTYPCVYEPVSVEIAFVPQSPTFNVKENWMVTYFKNVTNLDITWTMIEPSGARERITLMLNSGDLPDAIQGFSFSPSDIVQYGVGDGLLRPLNDLLQYCPEFTKVCEDNPSVIPSITATDGNIYGFPGLSNVYSYLMRFFINSVWLKNVGLEIPKTLTEFKEMLIAFRDNDANGNGNQNDEIPWTGSWNEGGSERNFILNAYGYNSRGGNLAIDYSGDKPVICYIPYSEYYKDYLYYMHELWQEELLDKDMFTQNETQAQAKVLSGTVGFSFMSAPYVYDPEHQEDWVAVIPLVDNEGDTPVCPKEHTVMNTALFVISSDINDEKAAALANFADGYYSLETYAFATYGPEAGSELDYYGWGHYYDPEKNTILYNLHPNATDPWQHRTTYLTFWKVPGMVANGYDPYRLAYAKKYPNSAIGQQFKNGIVSRSDEISQQVNQSPYYAEVVPNFFMALDDLNRINELVTPLDDYVASMEAQFITGVISIAEQYDTFIKTLEDYGVKEYVEIYTKYYEDYKSRK